MNEQDIIKKCNMFLDFSQQAKKQIIDYCGIDRKVILNHHEQTKLFGAPFYDDLRLVSMFCQEWGVTIVGKNGLHTVSYSWHGLITPMLKSLMGQSDSITND